MNKSTCNTKIEDSRSPQQGELQEVKAPSAPSTVHFTDISNDIMMLISSFYPLNDMWVLRCVSRSLYNIPIMGYHAYVKGKRILSIRLCDGTGSMSAPLRNARACMLRKTIEFEREFPQYLLLESAVIYRDVRLNPSFETVRKRRKVADHTYSKEPFIIIQPPVKDRYKIYLQTKGLRAEGGNMVTGTESLDQALVQLVKTLGGYIIKPGLSNSSVTIIDIYRDTVGHFMGKDGSEIYHELYPMHGMDHDWVKAFKAIRAKNGIIVDFNMSRGCPISKYIGLIFAVGGFSFNTTSETVFESVRLSKAIVKSEIALREYLSKVYATVSSSMNGATRQEIKTAVMDFVEKDDTTIPNHLDDLNPQNMNIPSPELCSLVNSSNTMKDFELKSLLPSEAVITYFARVKGEFIVIGRTDEEAVEVRKKPKSSVSSVSFNPPPVPSLLRTSSCMPTFRSCFPSSLCSSLPPPSLPRRSVGFALELNTVHEGKSDEDDDMPVPGGPPSLLRSITCAAPSSSFDDEILPPVPFGMKRIATEAYDAGAHDFEDYGDALPPTLSIAVGLLPPPLLATRSVFTGTPWDGDLDSKGLKSFFKPGTVRPASREMLILKKPHIHFRIPVMSLEKYVREEKDLDKVQARIIKDQPYQKEIIEAGSFKNYVLQRWLTPKPTVEKINVQRESKEDDDAIPPLPPPMNRSVSLFTDGPPAPLFERARSEVTQSSTQVMRNINSQFDNM